MHKKTKISKIINGKNKIIYKKDGDRIQYVKHNGKYIKLQEYRKMVSKSKSKSKKIIGGYYFHINYRDECEQSPSDINSNYFTDNPSHRSYYYNDEIECKNALEESTCSFP